LAGRIIIGCAAHCVVLTTGTLNYAIAEFICHHHEENYEPVAPLFMYLLSLLILPEPTDWALSFVIKASKFFIFTKENCCIKIWSEEG
jgi:hypothetical protein